MVGLESSALYVGNGTSLHMTSLVVAVDKAFDADVPTGAHEGCFIPLRTIPCTFPCKITLPNLAFFHQEFGDGGRVFDDVFPFNFVGLPLFPSLSFAIVPRHGCGCIHWTFGRGVDKIREEDDIEGAVHDHLKNLVKTNKAVIDHQAVTKFLHSPSQRWM
jgi:hypothetical protein